jgi:glycosyltransferase involved in cell wall biosynthesis
MTRPVLIYANKVARRSETFIYFPAMAMQRYTPHFVGSRLADGFQLPPERVHIANGSGFLARVKQAVKQRVFGHNGVPDLAPQLQPLQPRLMQAHFGPESTNALPLAQRLEIPLIVYYHGFDATMTREYAQQNRFMRQYLKQLPQIQQQTALFLTASDFIRDCLIDNWGFPAEKVRTHYIGVEPPSQPPLPLNEREPYVLFVARLVEKKGATYLIEAMQKVQAQHPELELVIAGDGALRDTLEAQAAQQLTNYRFTGWQSPQQVNEWMQKARLFSVPSVTAAIGDSEGFGMVFIEAQRVGTPVISTRHGGIVESVADGITGLLVPERDSDALADQILHLYNDDARWQQFSQAGVKRVREQFNMYTLVSQLEAIYDELLE